jgi:3'-5' exoribonuclease
MISKATVDMKEGEVQKIWGLGKIYKAKGMDE